MDSSTLLGSWIEWTPGHDFNIFVSNFVPVCPDVAQKIVLLNLSFLGKSTLSFIGNHLNESTGLMFCVSLQKILASSKSLWERTLLIFSSSSSSSPSSSFSSFSSLLSILLLATSFSSSSFSFSSSLITGFDINWISVKNAKQ